MFKSILVLSFVLSFFCQAKTVKYTLTAERGDVNLSGKSIVRFALKLNGQIPAPTLRWTEGDQVEVQVNNQIPDEDLSIHWHGILLDPYMDGVPYVNTPPIKPGESYTFKFKIRQNGTFWYHSHTNVQEQKGLYGAIIIEPLKPVIKTDHEFEIVLSDWSDEDSQEILKNLRKDGEYYIYKKSTMRSWQGAIAENKLGNFLYNEFTRMGGMDFSDGSKVIQGPQITKGETVRLRIINASASTYFRVKLADLKMKIISLDGVDIRPTTTNEFLIGMAETYDILFKLPENKNYELKATAQDGSGETSTWIGKGEKVMAPTLNKPDLYALMDHASMGHNEHNNQHHHHHHEGHEPEAFEKFDVSNARALRETTFDANIKRHDVRLVLDGDMERYIWYINGKAIHQDRQLDIDENTVVRFTFENKTMMHHPMHLHGHFFRVINEGKEYSPLKHTVDIPPHSIRTIEFLANEPGEWMLHCHNLYHLKTGMARVVKYSSFTPNKMISQLQKQDPHLHDHLYYRGLLEAATNHAQAQLNFMNTWNEFEARAELRNDFGWEGEADLFYKRWLNKWTSLIAGAAVVERYGAPVLGLGYMLPFLVESHSLIDHRGRLRLDLEKRFQWSKTIHTDAEVTLRQKQPSEFEITLMYQDRWDWSAGLMFTEHSAGIGAKYAF